MPSTFWTNTIWFILLGISTVIELIVIFIKVKNRKQVLALYFIFAGMAFIFEIFVLSPLKAYEYFPMITPRSPFDDAVIGNLFSQLSVSATALLIAVFDLKYFWFLIFSGSYYAIEELFLILGIYKQLTWYRTWMTFLLLLSFFWIVKEIYNYSLNNIKPIFRYFFIQSGLIALYIYTMWIFRLFGVHSFSKTLETEDISVALTMGIYYFVSANALMVTYFLKIKWWWKLAVVLILYAANYAAYKFGFIYYKQGWFFVVTTISILSMYLYIALLDKLYKRPEKQLN
jgi:hypothetical protein